jgi:hypothetical protein
MSNLDFVRCNAYYSIILLECARERVLYRQQPLSMTA